MHVLTPSRLAIRRLRLIALLALIAMLMAFTRIVRDSSPSLVVPGQAFTAAGNAAPPLHSSPRSDRAAEWRVNGGEGGDHYSSLDDITRANVGSLRVAWVYRTGDVSDGAPDTHGPSTAFEATPLLLDSTLYIATPSSRVVALDPERGTARWIFDAGLERAALGDMEVTARGVAGWVDSSLMRFVDIMYGLPYVLLVILFKIAFEPHLITLFKKLQFEKSAELANGVVLFAAIGLVSWLTMARVVRGQVLSLRSLPYIEACRALGLKERRIFIRHILPNLIGPITVYATLTVPSAILQESFLSFLGVGVNPPLATWGSLASEGVEQLSPLHFYWWLLLFPCALLAVTLLSLNFLGDGLRDVFDPKKEAAKI